MQKENTMTVGRWCGRSSIANRHKWDGNTEGGYRNPDLQPHPPQHRKYCERSGIGSAHKSQSYHIRE